jgi:hypothetical protein
MIWSIPAFKIITLVLVRAVSQALPAAAINSFPGHSNIGSDELQKIWIRANREDPVTELTIEISSKEKIGAVQFELVFPAVGVFQQIEPAALLPSALIESNILEPGRLRVAVVSSEPITGSGEFARLRFASLPVSNPATELRLENIQAWHLESLAAVPVEAGKTMLVGGETVQKPNENIILPTPADEVGLVSQTRESSNPIARDEIRKIVFDVLRELNLSPQTASAKWSGWVYFAAGVVSTLLFMFWISKRGKQ